MCTSMKVYKQTLILEILKTSFAQSQFIKIYYWENV